MVKRLAAADRVLNAYVSGQTEYKSSYIYISVESLHNCILLSNMPAATKNIYVILSLVNLSNINSLA